MTTINITTARQNLFQLVQNVNKGFNPVNIINSKGEDAVLISGSDWRDIEETIYLNSIPGLAESIISASEEDTENMTVYDRNEEW